MIIDQPQFRSQLILGGAKFAGPRDRRSKKCDIMTRPAPDCT
jgi:hypothetical protein